MKRRIALPLSFGSAALGSFTGFQVTNNAILPQAHAPNWLLGLTVATMTLLWGPLIYKLLRQKP
jgi:hypothetical protein